MLCHGDLDMVFNPWWLKLEGIPTDFRSLVPRKAPKEKESSAAKQAEAELQRYIDRAFP